MKRALITGITGQDGAYLAELLLEKGYEVHGIKRRSSSFNTSRIDHLFQNEQYQGQRRFQLHYGDVTDATNIIRVIQEIQPDEIYHLAAQSHVAVSFETPEYTAQADALGTLRMLEAIRILGLTGKVKFYQASTSELFGNAKQSPQNEDTPFAPRSPYAAAKLYSYWITRNYREAYGLFACNGILFNHESPLRGETFVTRKITRAVVRIKHNLQQQLVLGNLDAKRDWGYAKEYVAAMWAMLQINEPQDLVIATGKGYRLYSRRGIDITKQFPELNISDRIHAKNCILDGEIIAYNKKGFPDFRFIEGRSELSNQDEIREKVKNHPATYAVFDILVKDGKSLMAKPFVERRKILGKTVSPSKRVELLRSTHDGKKLFAFAKKNKLEGVMAKDPQGIYSPGKRTRAWQKVKLMKSVECVIVGYTQESKLISALALGLYKDGKLIYIGRVGTGFSETKIKELYPKLLKNRATKSATVNEPKLKGLLFVKPKLVAEVRYLEMTPTGCLRHTSYLHYRDDKKPKECTFDQL